MENDKPVVKKTLAEILQGEQGNNPPVTPPATPPDTPPATPPTTDPPPAPTFNPVSYFNEKFKTAFEKEEDIETHFSSLNERSTKAQQLEAEIENERVKAKQLADESVNVFMQEFGINDDQLRFFKAKSVFPETDPNVLNQVLTNDFTKTLKEDPLEILITKERFDHPELSEDQATRRVYKKYEIEGSTDDNGKLVIEDDTLTDVKIDAKEALKAFNQAKEQVKLPERVDIAKRKEEQEKLATERYNNIKPLLEKEFKNIPDRLDKVEIFKEKQVNGKTEKELVYSFSLGDYGKSAHVKKELDQAIDYLSRTMPEFSQELVEKAVNQSAEVLKAQRILSQLPDILLSAKEQWYAQWRKEENLAEHNPLKFNADGSPAPPLSDEEKRKAKAEADLVAKNPRLKHKEVFAR